MQTWNKVEVSSSSRLKSWVLPVRFSAWMADIA